MIIDNCELNNGIRLLHVRNKGEVSIFGAMVNAGSRDEHENETGYAHLTEHMLFKGTRKRNYVQIINRVEDVGGDINAFTTKEDTTLYTTFMKRHLPRMMELVCDMIFHPDFSDEMLSREAEVIADEIDSYLDNPLELILDDFEDEIFSGNSIGHNILGDKKVISKATKESLSTFYKRCYTADNILFFCMGEYSFERVRQMLERLTADIPASKRTFSRVLPTPYASKRIHLAKETQQVHCVLGNRAYTSTDDRRNCLALLNNILGGSYMSSKLNMSLREKHGLVYTVESQYTPYSDTGNWNIYMGADKSDIIKAVSLAKGELKNLIEWKINDHDLEKAKKKFLAQLTLGGEVKENWILATTRQFMENGRVLERNEIEEIIMSVSAKQLQDIAADIFDESKLSELYYE